MQVTEYDKKDFHICYLQGKPERVRFIHEDMSRYYITAGYINLSEFRISTEDGLELYKMAYPDSNLGLIHLGIKTWDEFSDQIEQVVYVFDYKNLCIR